MGDLLILGAGGHGKVVADIAQKLNKWKQIAFLDDAHDLKKVMGIPVIGGLGDYPIFKKDFQYAFIAIGDNKVRLKWFKRLIQAGFIVPSLIHPFSFISKYSEIGSGSVVMGGSVINVGVKIGHACIINTSASIDHDCILKDGVHLSPGVNIGGKVNVGECTWIGIGAKVINNVNISSNVLIAAGAVIVNNIPPNVLMAGVPAIIKKDLGSEYNEG